MKRAPAIAVAFMVAASASLLTAASPASAQGWRELGYAGTERGSSLRDLLPDRMQSRADLRDLIMDKLAERAALRDLLQNRLERRADSRSHQGPLGEPGRYPRSYLGPDEGPRRPARTHYGTAWRTAAAVRDRFEGREGANLCAT